MTPKDFIALGHTEWIEIHWTIAQTLEAAQKVLEERGISGEIYRMCYPVVASKSDGFFAWWIVR